MPADTTRDRLMSQCLAYGPLADRPRLDPRKRVAAVLFESELDAR